MVFMEYIRHDKCEMDRKGSQRNFRTTDRMEQWELGVCKANTAMPRRPTVKTHGDIQMSQNDCCAERRHRVLLCEALS